MDKLKLIILAIAISVPVCSSLIWALSKTFRIGGPAGDGIILLFIIPADLYSISNHPDIGCL